MKKRGVYRPKTIDRVVFAILGVLHVLNGLYLVGPFYLSATTEGKAPLYNLFNSYEAVKVYGSLLLLNGIVLIWTSFGNSKWYTQILDNALFFGFLVRCYSLIAVFLTLESWRPPSYLSHVANVLLLGSYWLWVRICARPTE